MVYLLFDKIVPFLFREGTAVIYFNHVGVTNYEVYEYLLLIAHKGRGLMLEITTLTLRAFKITRHDISEGTQKNNGVTVSSSRQNGMSALAARPELGVASI